MPTILLEQIVDLGKIDILVAKHIMGYETEIKEENTIRRQDPPIMMELVKRDGVLCLPAPYTQDWNHAFKVIQKIHERPDPPSNFISYLFPVVGSDGTMSALDAFTLISNWTPLTICLAALSHCDIQVVLSLFPSRPSR